MEHSSGNKEFDSTLGGSQTIPNSLLLSEFMKHRMEEIVMLTETVQESPFRGQTFQRLPKHMRRRQMSHHIKRLPRRLQRPFLMSLKEELPKPTKRPSRKYRRRPSNLLEEYNRRQKKHIWLETHIWHAKRFHMVNKWGYRLPERPTNKSFKACYRAISEHCLLTDISYNNCIELQSSEAKLLQGLQQCISPECGLSFAAKSYISGSREGHVALFHPNSYPYHIIGNVNFIWKPVNTGDETRSLWIWVHPAIHNEVVECFRTLFDLKEYREQQEEINLSEEAKINEKKPKKMKKRGGKLSKKRIEQVKLDLKNVPFYKTPKFISKDNSVKMILLKDTLNRFQLTGPLSQAIISQAFSVMSVVPTKEKTPEVELLEIHNKKRKLDDIEIIHEVNKKIKTMSVENSLCVEPENKTKWWELFYNDDVCKKNWEDQKVFYAEMTKCTKPSDVPSGLVLSLVVSDPRLTIPNKREKAVPNLKAEPCQLTIDSIKPNLCQSPIWASEVRDEVSLGKLTTQEINNARSKQIVPGFDVKNSIPDEKQSRIPILLVQRPGREDPQFGKLGFGSGWDIIAPAGFGMPIWLSLILRGARTGGLREVELLNLESNRLSSYLQPDSNAGLVEARSKYEQLRTAYFKLPPNKRPNFVKLGVPTPFYCAWEVLVQNWILTINSESEKVENFSVLRNVKVLKQLNEIVRKFEKYDMNLDGLQNISKNCIVPVVLECPGKGKPKDFALICLPDKADLQNLKQGELPTEPSKLDENEKVRKVLKLEHSKLLKSLRRKRRKDRSKLKEEFANNLPNKLKWQDILKSNSAPSDTSSKEYNSKMESLWLPDLEKVNDVMNSCSRKVLGFVVKGDFCFSKSNGVGVGYVTLLGLMALMSVCKENGTKLTVLFRNTNHVQYKIGELRVLHEW